jgi:HNH endonuclease
MGGTGAMLTTDRLKRLLDYSAETGLFVWKLYRGSTIKPGDVAGSDKGNGYVQIRVDGTLCLAHRLAWFYVTGSWPLREIDHINGDRSDNRFANLRDVSTSVNGQNARRARSCNSSGLLGVSFDKSKNRFAAQITTDGKHTMIGRYKTAAEAHAVYIEEKRKAHPGCTI